MLRLGLRRGPALARSGVLRSRRSFATGIVIPGTPRALRDVAKIDMLESEEPTRIGAIWEAYHGDGTDVAGPLPGSRSSNRLAPKAAASRRGVLPRTWRFTATLSPSMR